MNKTEKRLIESAANDPQRVVKVRRHWLNGMEHKAACYLHAEAYGIYFPDCSEPYFLMHPHVKRAVLARLKRAAVETDEKHG